MFQHIVGFIFYAVIHLKLLLDAPKRFERSVRIIYLRGPPQSNCPPDLVPLPVFIWVMVRLEISKERCFIVDESPSYAIQLNFQIRAKLQ